MTLVYRILGFFINLIAFFFALSLLVIIPVAIGSPALWLPTFLIIAIVLYSWFSNQFHQRVLQRQQIVRRRLKDLIRVNGIVAVIFGFLNIPPIIVLLRNPSAYIAATKEMMKQFGPEYQQSFKAENVHIIGIVMLVYLVVLLIHVFWTFALMKKYKDFFQE